ncbi:MAG: amino acid adenylation domain-containing protein, partial [Proteobacteria bacterium]|nr:amino acid adenylation domain-containing protein [Pseudomonadota bacterium]
MEYEKELPCSLYSIILSPYSKLFYVEWKLDQERYDYNIVFDQQFEGKIDRQRLNNAIKRLISEYIILNSHVEEKKENLYWKPNNKIHDLEYFKGKLTDKKNFSYISKPFDLENGPLYRFALIELEKDKFRFIVVFHHIIIDGLSFDYFIDELSHYYNDEHHRNTISLEDQLVSISDLSQQLLRYATLNKEKSIQFWKEKLAEMAPLELSFLKCGSTSLLKDLQKNLELSLRELSGIGQIRYEVPKEILLKLEKLSKKYKISPYFYSQVIYALLLHRYTGQDKFCINYPIAIKEGTNFIYGSQINVNVIPYDFSRVKNVLELIKRTQDFIQSLQGDSINYSYFPIPEIISASHKNILDLPCSKTNLKDKKFQFNNIEAYKNENTEIDLSSELFFEQEIHKDRINFRVRYKASLLNDKLVNEFIECYKRLFIEVLDQLLKNKDISCLPHIKEYSILTPQQSVEIVTTWNQTDTLYPYDKSVAQVFEEQAFKMPHAVALIKDNQSLTYEELNTRSNQLAHYLRERGVGRATFVGIAVERSFEMIIGILGILKVGAAYVPLDPTYPRERLQFMIEESGIPIILTDIRTIDKLPATWAHPICLDEEWVHIKNLPRTNLNHHSSPDDLAYIIYTSGSTGKPKGVSVTQRCLITSTWARADYYHGVPLNIPIFSSISFDITTGLIFWSLLREGCLFLPEEDINQRPADLINYIRKNKITHVTFVPSVYNLLLQAKEFSELEHLEVVFLGGEECPKDLVLKHIESLPQVALYNEYGPTENTVWATVDKVYDPIFKKGKEFITIGKPRLNTRVYILDENLNPTPIGVRGEIFIGGPGLAQGYLNQPELTAEKFIPNPFYVEVEQSNINLRLYRTGDIGRFLPSGDIEFMGRGDEQVKVRGFRIELGEIESFLKAQGNITQALVIAREDESGDKKLVAYIVPNVAQVASFDIVSTFTSPSGFSFSMLGKENIESHQEDLKKNLGTFLPDYMIPSY